MTPEREDQLLSDVAEIKGQLKSYFDQVAPTLATKESVTAVDTRLTTHIDNHKETRTAWPAWVGIAVSSAIGIYAIIRGGH